MRNAFAKEVTKLAIKNKKIILLSVISETKCLTL